MRALRLVHAVAAVLVTGAVTGGGFPPLAAAADLLPPVTPVERAVDHYVDAGLAAAAVTPAPQADAATLVRRLTLDLVGRVPTLPEVEAFAASADPDRRAKLVDGLLASPAFARYQAVQFDAMLGYAGGKKRGGGDLQAYFAAALAENRRWDRVFRELMLPDDADPKLKGASDFLRPRVADADRLTTDVSVAFFGVNVSCAQCHDHPHVKDWTQDLYYGMKAFLARSYESGGTVAEQPAGVVKYKPIKGPEKVARMTFFTGAAIDHPSNREPTADEMKKAKAAKGKPDAKTPPAPPAFSARGKLVEVALEPGNADLFARSIANRMWHRFFGVGLVNPLDQMHAENPPSHPELLAWLARDAAGHGYDLKRLIRGLVMSNAYSRGDRTDSDAPPDPQLFAVARVRPLTPMQLATSLKVVGQDPLSFEKLSPADLDKRIEGYESTARGFASLLAPPADNLQIGVGEALLFSNGDRLSKDFLTDGAGTLLGRLKATSDTNAAVDLMVRTALGRPPTADERAALTSFLAKRADRPADAHRQAVWALVTCPEFRFNH